MVTKFPTSTDFYYRIKHDPNINPSGIKITYLDSLKKKYIDIDFSKWVFVEDGGDIPIHRVYFFKYKNEIIWDRENKILNLEPIFNGLELKLPESFNLLSWNILNPKYTSKKKSGLDLKKNQERQNKIIEQISNFLQSMDVICLQEVDKIMLDNLKKNIDPKYNIISTDLTSGDNIVFITKYFICSITNIPFSLEKESIKISIESILGFVVNIFGVHLTSDSQTNSPHKRLEQLEKLSKFIDPNSTNIICGDFNEDNSTHFLLTDVMIDTYTFKFDNLNLEQKTHELSDELKTNQILTQNNYNYEKYTYDPKNNKLAWENSTTKQPHRYDKIFINGLLKPTKPVKIMSDVDYSDHYPIISWLELEPNNNISNVNLEKKNTTSGLFIIVPPQSTDYIRIQNIRKELDENYSKWMPHLSIHLGWIPESNFYCWLEENDELFKKIVPFEIELDTPDYFTHDSTYTLILRPNKSCSYKLINLFKLFGSNSEPHLTLGKFKDKSKLDSGLKFVKDLKLSVKWNLTKLHLVSKKNRDYGVQLGLINFGQVENTCKKIPKKMTNTISNVISDISNQIKCIFPNIQIFLGGSQIYFQNYNSSDLDLGKNSSTDSSIDSSIDSSTDSSTDSDLDLVITGLYDQNDFYSKINKFFQSNGNFIHSKFVSNKFMSFIRVINNDYQEIDLHYLETKCTDINKILDYDQKIKSSVYWDNIWINDFVKSNGFEKIFIEGLIDVKNKFKQARIYGQEFCYIGGISLAIMLSYYFKKNKPCEWNLMEFCKFYSVYNFSHPICFDQSIETNKDPHIFTTIIGPVSRYNTSRNLTKSTFTTLKWYLDNNFESNMNFDYKLQFSFGTTNYYLYDDIKSYIRSIYLKIILTIEKNISNSNFRVYPLSTNKKTNLNKYNYEYRYEFGFNFNPNSISNIFEELKNKILILYPDVSFCQIIIT